MCLTDSGDFIVDDDGQGYMDVGEEDDHWNARGDRSDPVQAHTCCTQPDNEHELQTLSTHKNSHRHCWVESLHMPQQPEARHPASTWQDMQSRVEHMPLMSCQCPCSTSRHIGHCH
jgi:hypothetical protein